MYILLFVVFVYSEIFATSFLLLSRQLLWHLYSSILYPELGYTVHFSCPSYPSLGLPSMLMATVPPKQTYWANPFVVFLPGCRSAILRRRT
ncbi:hypothetical protein LZ32DRAFT_155781 [Colletotrichum eremochloae]|nr:hypothetical protein LZ32DRAFT_155781 [Colletotrichum eremochloae]